jgi:ubiquinone biosynthesis protein
VGNGRLGAVTKIMGQLVAGEASRAIGVGRRRRSEADDSGVDRQRARAVRRALEDLGPFYVKIGQMLSTRPDIVPEVMIEELENLHEQVKIAPFSSFEPVLDAELGSNWRSYFKEIQTDKPLGAASLAQVYGVTLASGKNAVVKIQRPGIRPIMLDDMALLRKASKQLAKRAPDFNAVIDVESMLGVLFDAMEPELDFTLEAANMRKAREQAEQHEYITVPEVIFDTPRVLVQEMAPGKSIRHVNRDDFSAEDREAIGKDLLSFMFKGFFVERSFHADPHPGNIFIAPGEKAYIIDWGMIGRADRRMSMTILLVIMALAQNDGTALAKAWIELGRPTPWANIPGFISDMQNFVPKVAGASMQDLNFGVALTSILKFSTRRGIQTSSVVSLLGKSFANLEGSIRYLSPELAITDTLEDELKDIMMELARETLSQEAAAKAAVEGMMAAASMPEQFRSVLRDISNREFTFLNNQVQGPDSRREDRADKRAAAMRRTLVGLAGAAVYWDYRRRR